MQPQKKQRTIKGIANDLMTIKGKWRFILTHFKLSENRALFYQETCCLLKKICSINKKIHLLPSPLSQTYLTEVSKLIIEINGFLDNNQETASTIAATHWPINELLIVTQKCAQC